MGSAPGHGGGECRGGECFYDSHHRGAVGEAIRNGVSNGFLPRHFQGRNLRTFQHAEREPKWPVYHFVYHCNREGPLADANTLSGQKQNLLI